MKKLAKITLILCVMSVMALLFVSCGCDHQEVIDEEIPATCTEVGLSEGKHCSVCNEVLVEQVEIPALGHAEETIAPVEANCTQKGSTEGKKCTICGEITVKPEEIASLGHTTTTGTCERCNTSFGIFSIGYYIDEFDQPTTDGYVRNTYYIDGKFSNSATTNSRLYVQLLVDANDIVIFLYEYGTHLVKNSSTRYVDEYSITMKTADGTKHDISGTVYCGGDRLFIDDKHKSTVLNALKSGEEVSFYIVNNEHTTTNYLFSFNSSNFQEKYEELFG